MNELYCMECGFFGKPYVYYIRNVPRRIGKQQKCHNCGSISIQKQKPINHKILTYKEYKDITIRELYNK